jgi:exopolyphosphatase / guanosine-5'-triphosphate,3'-diphosphate pyrophosphatase
LAVQALTRPAAKPHAAAARIGVIDVGSNSIRLVVFAGSGRAPMTLFNEKVLCGLGRGLDASGRLNEGGVKLALENLARFVWLARAMDVNRLDLLATAAVRDAENGPAFVGEVERRCGVKVRIITGTEEARLSASGVLSGIPGADGIMGDLGGGSLELVVLNKGRIGSHTTLPLGPIRLMENVLNDIDAARDVVDKHLDRVDWLNQAKGRDFHPVGGAWRNLARMHMEQVGHPLHVIHEYAIERREAEELARLVSRLSKRTLVSIPGMSKRRAETLPFAALVLERILRIARPARILFSAHGLREGHLYDVLPAEEKARDPLLAACQELARHDSRFGDTGELLDDWIAPLFKGDDAKRVRLRRAACTLSDIGWREHPDYRATQVFQRIVHLPVGGIDHAGRVSVAYTIFVRYGSDEPTADMSELLTLVGDDDREYWRRVGLALRLAFSVSAATPAVLKETAVRMGDSKIRLLLPKGQEALFGESVERRFNALGKAFDRAVEVSIAR